MGLLEKLLLLPVTAFVIGTASLVLVRMLDGTIRTRGLLSNARTGRASALSVQKLIATLAFASTYAASIRSSSSSLPPVSAEMLALVGGSNALSLLNRSFYHVLASLKDAVGGNRGTRT